MLGLHRTYPLLLLALVLAFTAAGCGAGEESTPPKVIASNSQLLDLVQQIGGDQVSASGLAPAATNPHTWTPPSLAGDQLKAADVVFHAGGDLEPWFDAVKSVSQTKAEVIDLSKSVKTISRGGRVNGHWATDPTNAKLAAVKIAATLSSANPGGADAYSENLKKFEQAATEADELLQVCATKASPEQLRVVAGHDDLDYLAKRYGIKIVAKLAASGDQTPGPAQEARTLARAKSGDARLVSTPWGELDTQAALLAQKLDVTKVAVFTDALSNLTESAKSLLGSIGYTVGIIISSVNGGKNC